MGLVFFDLDHTLLNGDSDREWTRFLIDEGVINQETSNRVNEQFYADYAAGTLDIHAFARFAFAPLASQPIEKLELWRTQYLRERVEPMITHEARALVEKHRKAGDTLVMVTATNSFVTRPIADLFAIEHLIATEPRRKNNRYLAEIEGIPAFREGKVARLKQWLASRPELSKTDSWCYSDSHNDLPLLEFVNHPVAVNPDKNLAEIAVARGWPILDLHQTTPAERQDKSSAKA